MLRVVQPRFSGLMPQIEHAAHCHIDPALGKLIVVPAVLQQVQHCSVHLDRGNPRVVVDLLQAAGVIVVDVKQLVIFLQGLMHLLRPLLESLLRFFIPPQGGDGVEHIQKNRLIHLLFFLPAAGKEHQNKQEGNYFFHHGAISFF